MSNLKQIVAYNGKLINVDASKVACLPFGFKHGDIVIDVHNRTGKVEGVARNPFSSLKRDRGKLFLWVSMDCDRKMASYHNILKAPTYFRLKNET